MHHDESGPKNRSGNQPFTDILTSRLERRAVMKGGLLGAASFLGGVAALRDGTGTAVAQAGTAGQRESGLLGFSAISASGDDTVRVPEGYTTQVMCRWGSAIQPGGPAWTPDASATAAEQAQQFGMGHDGMHYFPLGRPEEASRRGLLVMNHEYTVDEHLFPDGTANWTAAKTEKSQVAHGVSIVAIRRRPNGRWRVVRSRFARRISPLTPVGFAGPARGHRLMRTAFHRRGTAGLGTLNNCAHGVTPWGTYLTCEENFNGYFHVGADGTLTEEQAGLLERYGVEGEGFGYLWATTDERYRADLHPNQTNHFGWVVEIDPRDPDSTPVKRTALGRVKHEGATCTTAPDGRVVVYLGDDERFEYLYKWVSAEPWEEMVAAGVSPLDEGVLYVARFDADGTGRWLPLVHGEGPLTPVNGFADQGDVVIKARLAADALGATPMDRPEWVAVHPYTGEVYCSLTNNTRREGGQEDAANPRPENTWGHIIRWRERPALAYGGRHFTAQSTSFDWDIYVLAGPGGGVDGSTVDAASAFGSPDGLWFDAAGRLWIQTDGEQPEGNNQMLVADPSTGELRRFLTGPVDCEVTGITATPDGRTLFVNIQHPGDSGPATNPTETSTWPDGPGSSRPRPATVVIQRADGRRV
jgi:hypothetical protein